MLEIIISALVVTIIATACWLAYDTYKNEKELKAQIKTIDEAMLQKTKVKKPIYIRGV